MAANMQQTAVDVDTDHGILVVVDRVDVVECGLHNSMMEEVKTEVRMKIMKVNHRKDLVVVVVADADHSGVLVTMAVVVVVVADHIVAEDVVQGQFPMVTMMMVMTTKGMMTSVHQDLVAVEDDIFLVITDQLAINRVTPMVTMIHMETENMLDQVDAVVDEVVEVAVVEEEAKVVVRTLAGVRVNLKMTWQLCP